MGGHRRSCRKSSTSAGQAAGGQPGPRPSRASLGLRPDLEAVMRAIDSLYADQLKPFGRILRKRIAEHASGASLERLYVSPGGGPEPLPDVDVAHLRAVCEGCHFLRLAPEEGGDWSAVVVGRPEAFVDVYDTEDIYPQDLWNRAEAYFNTLTTPDKALPGGRYACAQALVSKQLDFFADCTLGQICHIVQLAITQKKVLGYCNGAVVPYSASQSMMKEHCAEQQQPCTSSDAAAMPLATWEVARTYLKEILQSAAPSEEGGLACVPLSNVKRLFRSRYQTELSETMLGHSRLSELIQDEHFQDICILELQKSGYVVVQRLPPPAPVCTRISLAASLSCSSCPAGDAVISLQRGLQLEEEDAMPTRPLPFCVDEPLCFDELGQATPLPSPGVPASATVKHWLGEPHRLAFLPDDEPLSDSTASTAGEVREPKRVLFCPDEPLCFDTVDDAKSQDSSALGSLLVSTPLPSPGEPPSATVRRWTGLADFFAAEPLAAKPLAEPLAVATPLPSPGVPPSCTTRRWSDAPCRVEFCPDEPLLLEEIQPGVVEAPTPLASPGVPASATVRRWAGEPRRLEFLQDRVPATLSPSSAAGCHRGRTQRRAVETPTLRWAREAPLPSFASALSALSDVDSLVQNTFIHAKQLPPTPLTRRRAHSVPRDTTLCPGNVDEGTPRTKPSTPAAGCTALQHALADLEPLEEHEDCSPPCSNSPVGEAVSSPHRPAFSPVLGWSVRNTFIHSLPTPSVQRPTRRAQSTPPDLSLCRGAAEALDHALRVLPELLSGIETKCEISLPLSGSKSPTDLKGKCDLALPLGACKSPCASGCPAFVPLSPALTASPTHSGRHWHRGETGTVQQVVRLADYV